MSTKEGLVYSWNHADRVEEGPLLPLLPHGRHTTSISDVRPPQVLRDYVIRTWAKVVVPSPPYLRVLRTRRLLRVDPGFPWRSGACRPPCSVPLLLRAGIESNPGPTWPCSTCGKSAHRGSILCTSCDLWVHTKKSCRSIKASEYIRGVYKCPSCMSRPPAVEVQPPPHPAPPRHPGRQPQTSGDAPITIPSLPILQWNANGIRLKASELHHFLVSKNIKVAAIQETKLITTSRSPVFPGFTLCRQDRERTRRGWPRTSGVSLHPFLPRLAANFL